MNSQYGASFSTFVSFGFRFADAAAADDDDAYAPRRSLVDRTREEDGDARVAIARATNRARNIRDNSEVFRWNQLTEIIQTGVKNYMSGARSPSNVAKPLSLLLAPIPSANDTAQTQRMVMTMP